MPALRTSSRDYPDDIFQDTRMTFGEHLEELRARMILALYGLGICLVAGFVLDFVGSMVGNKKIGIGRPMLDVITEPVESQVRDFYFRRVTQVAAGRLPAISSATGADAETLAALQKRADERGLTDLSADERALLVGKAEEMPVIVKTGPLAEALGLPADKVGRPEVELKAQVYPAWLSYLSDRGQALLESRKYLSTLSVQEGFVVYFKASLLCGAVISSPWLLFQFWSFVGAGLYPHEKRYVYLSFWPSVLLFLSGVALCQFLVLPGAVKALLGFNEMLGFDPEIRLNEWFGLALILPLVFGVSFQTPLVMIFFNRIGMFTAQDYLSKWRGAFFALAVFAAIITPTPDVITMMYLFIPMFGLYLVGIVVCTWFPGVKELDADADEVPEDEIAV